MSDKESSSATSYAFSPEYPGKALKKGCRGADVAIMQSYLNAMAAAGYTGIAKIKADGIFGAETREAVLQFQNAAGLKADGIIGPDTWKALTARYESLPERDRDAYPGYSLKEGSRGAPVADMQTKLNGLSVVYGAINAQKTDGKFGPEMKEAVIRFQRQFGLEPDGIIGKATWDKIALFYEGLMQNELMPVSPVYHRRISKGSEGEDVRLVQSYLNGINRREAARRARLRVDGVFGGDTRRYVMKFQAENGLPADGTVGRKTWVRLVKAFNNAILD